MRRGGGWGRAGAGGGEAGAGDDHLIRARGRRRLLWEPTRVEAARVSVREPTRVECGLRKIGSVCIRSTWGDLREFEVCGGRVGRRCRPERRLERRAVL